MGSDAKIDLEKVYSRATQDYCYSSFHTEHHRNQQTAVAYVSNSHRENSRACVQDTGNWCCPWTPKRRGSCFRLEHQLYLFRVAVLVIVVRTRSTRSTTLTRYKFESNTHPDLIRPVRLCQVSNPFYARVTTLFEDPERTDCQSRCGQHENLLSKC
jgi:hypothetical protein